MNDNHVRINSPILPYRYDYFTVWGNGLNHTDEILDILRSESSLEILRIERRQIKNMRKFVFQLYACDTVPIEHLRAKLQYLDNVVPEIILIFVRNSNPQEEPTGTGHFRKVQCQNINRIKWYIRDIFNPRINGQRTEEHVIHASDYEEQVDYCLRLIGNSKGIQYLAAERSGLTFNKPYHIDQPDVFTFRTIEMRQLRANILTDFSAGVVKVSLVKIEQTPHYRALQNGSEVYRDYLKRFRFTLLTDNHSWENLCRMSSLTEQQIKSFDPIIVTPVTGYYRILDGVHRAAVAAYRGLDRIKCVEVPIGN